MLRNSYVTNFKMIDYIKVWCVFPMAVVSLYCPRKEFGPNDYEEHAPHFMNFITLCPNYVIA